ncbi:DUF3991 and toprim domain-containing protein (plasmid) [Aminobacter sp. NyZ550]|uniref:DUF3991 and toprim domain-containing protein n=1 Tax=unclassified Aminobacter TaxID=2644704 RepID=UPI0021D5C6FF|nr:DUF3991 and toprim domain-containing protein [Aminobacter sp. NyZ550]WAX98745.1 DUF3991 and toprim domain-containing protein [Aminobacter sp. NyZ550]
MGKTDLEELRGKVPCSAVLEEVGFALDLKESTRKAMKYRRGAEIMIVIHDGKGWFDPLGDDKGDVFSLVEHLRGVRFVEAMHEVASLIGFVPSHPVWERQARENEPDLSIPERWRARRKPWKGSATWRYLHDERGLPERIIRIAISANLVREGPHGSMWAAHTDGDGALTGWEERGPDWRGFASGGAKVLFRLGRSDALRLCVTEAAIDAMSLAAIEEMRPGSFYLSAGGGWSPATSEALRTLASRPGSQIVAATDANSQGQVFVDRLREIAENVCCDWVRLTPPAEDWNDALRMRNRQEEEEREEGGEEGGEGLPHARRSPQG